MEGRLLPEQAWAWGQLASGSQGLAKYKWKRSPTAQKTDLPGRVEGKGRGRWVT